MAEDEVAPPAPDPPGVGSGSSRRSVASPVTTFALAGIVALVIVSLATAIASRRLGEREAITNARTTTVIKAQGVVERAISDALLDADAGAVAAVDEVVRRDVLDDSLVRVKIWTADGTIVYSDEQRLIGDSYRLGEEQLDSLRTGRIEAEVSSLGGPENVFERAFGKLLEVYLPVRAPSGERLLFEAYYRYEAVATSGNRLWLSFAPITIGALVMLQLVQIPLAWDLARRLRARLREREGLLRRALHASEVERRQIAGDLHDGAVQELAGVAYALSAAGRRGGGRPADEAALVADSAEAIRKSIRELRSLIVDIYPPNLTEVSFGSALSELLERARERGLRAELHLGGNEDRLAEPVTRLLYRVAQEGVRNVLTHADATRVTVTARVTRDTVVLEVVDDGRGLDPAATDRRASGHVGLTALRDLVADAGGVLELHPNEPSGTTLRAEVSR